MIANTHREKEICYGLCVGLCLLETQGSLFSLLQTFLGTLCTAFSFCALVPSVRNLDNVFSSFTAVQADSKLSTSPAPAAFSTTRWRCHWETKSLLQHQEERRISGYLKEKALGEVGRN